VKAISISDKTFKDIDSLIKDFEYVEKRVGPAAVAAALNHTMNSARVAVTKHVRDESRLMYRRGGKDFFIGPKGDGAVKLKHVRNRLKVRKAAAKKPEVRLKAYISDMAAIRVAEGNPAAVKKIYVASATQATKKRKAKIGGLRVGRRQYPGAFLNKVDSNKTYQFMMRLQPKTWQKGHSGWADWRKGDKNRNRYREPYTVLKYSMREAFQDTQQIVDKVFAEKFKQNYHSNFSYYAGRAAAKKGKI
jgi:hypothetical protein